MYIYIYIYNKSCVHSCKVAAEALQRFEAKGSLGTRFDCAVGEALLLYHITLYYMI